MASRTPPVPIAVGSAEIRGQVAVVPTAAQALMAVLRAERHLQEGCLAEEVGVGGR